MRDSVKYLKDASSAKEIFRDIVHSYDFLNTVLSLGLHMRWREVALRSACITEGMRVMDLCTGTGDMAHGILRYVTESGLVVGMDFCEPMIQKALAKYPREAFPRLSFLIGDALNVPFPDRSFDVVTIAFGLRNIVFVEKALKEIRRILNDNGRLLILEFTKPPKGQASHLYGIYRTYILPAVGGLLSGRYGAYRYLANSIDSFDSAGELKERLHLAGFDSVDVRSLSMGVVSVLIARKSGDGREGIVIDL